MLCLVRTDTGQIDLTLDDGSDQAAVETLIYAALLTDAEAPETREADRYQRRGWWADPQAGTGLWHVRRQPLSPAARREAIGMIRVALLGHGITDLEIQDATPTAGSDSRLMLAISGRHNGRTIAVRLPL